MKNILILILLVSVFIPSCENDIESRTQITDSKIVINSLMNTENTEHKIFVSLSYGDKVTFLTNKYTEVKVIVNDNKTIEAKFDKDNTEASIYKFNYTFVEGDKIKIVVKYDNYTAFANTKVLPSPQIIKIDTLFQKEEDLMQFNVLIKDRIGENNYYRIKMNEVVFGKDENDNLLLKYQNERVIITDEEPVLNEGNILSDENIFDFSDYENNNNIFSDIYFKDKEYSLKLYAYINNFVECIDVDNNFSGNVYFTKKVKFYLYNISEKEYGYRKVSDYIINGSDSFFSEPYTVPCNVQGGLGFVGIATIASYSIDLPYKEVVEYEDGIPNIDNILYTNR